MIDESVLSCKLSGSVDDSQRELLMWESREEVILLDWCDDCKTKSGQHDTRGRKNKLNYAVVGVPSILIPIVLGGLAPVMPCHSLAYSLGMMLVGLFSAFGIFFNFGKRQQLHFEFSGKFSELANEIDVELCKPKAHRVSCNVYLERIKLRYNALCSQAPTL